MIQAINTLSEFQRIEKSWDDLYQRSQISNLFLTHTWLSLWIRHFGDGKTFALLSVPDEGPQGRVNDACQGMKGMGADLKCEMRDGIPSSPVPISVPIPYSSKDENSSKDERCRPEAVVVLKRYIKPKTIGFIETDFSYYPDFLATPHSTAHIRDLLIHLKGLEKNYFPSKLIFAGVRVNSALCKNIEILTKDHWVPIFKYPSQMRSIVLSGTYDSYLKSQGAKFRSETRRKVRRVHSNYRVSLKQFSLGNEKAELFEMVRLIEQDSWKTQEGSAIIDNVRQLHFYGDVFTRYAEQDMARAYVLYFDGQPVSFILGILSDHTYYALKTSYRLLYREYSPGLVLFATVIESFFEGNVDIPSEVASSNGQGQDREGGGDKNKRQDAASTIEGARVLSPCHSSPSSKINRLEFLGSDARWKEEFSNHQEDFCTLELYPMGLKSLSYHMLYQYVRPLVKRLFH